MNSFDFNSFEVSILQESARSPIVAMMRLSMEIDRQLRMILASVGALSRYSGSNPVDAIDSLNRVAGVTIPAPLRASLADFWQVRNAVVHGETNQDGLALRAIDYGLRILRIIVGIFRPSFIVRETGVNLYRDANCMFRYPYGHGVILQSFSGDGKDYGTHIHPTMMSYEIGQSLSWEWNLNATPSWDETWYLDPLDDNKPKYAWTGSMEFRGRPIESV